MLAIRNASAKLAFLDVMDDGFVLQVVCNMKMIQESEKLVDIPSSFKDIHRLIKRGDIICKSLR